jgi:carboxyvinyl-carboxyphosphonate phosphorylmutase
MMEQKSPRQRFREILSGSRCFFPASVYDPVSARIAEDLGFEAGMFAGSVASLTVLGAPDLVVLTLTELADQARRICRASSIPLLVDADHGYGNALNVRRTIEELESAGVSALTIEDTVLPEPFRADAQRLVSLEEAVRKLEAAIDARRDPALVIAGRTAAVSITGTDEAIRRCRAFEKTGVDAVFLSGVKRREDLDAISAAIRVPLILGTVSKELNDRKYLGERGVKIALQGHLPIMAAMQSVYDVLRALREGSRPEEINGLASKELVKLATQEEHYAKWRSIRES